MPGHMLRASFISRKFVQSNPNLLFIFGDNMDRRGFGGQAKEMRGEPNAVGIPTKWTPARDEEAYFRDHDLPAVKGAIDEAIERCRVHLSEGGTVVVPTNGVGTGLSRLDQSAPEIMRYIEREIEGLMKFAQIVPTAF